MEEVCQFLKDCGLYYLATCEGDQPRVRPFGTAHIFEGKLYIQTGRSKKVAQQMMENGKVEICAFKAGTWVRLAATAVADDRLEPQESLLNDYPSLKDKYAPGDGNNQVFYLQDATATFESFGKEPRTVRF
jgi:uncharacterized pyridoxamine 5'-phosphate oxidase family protein